MKFCLVQLICVVVLWLSATSMALAQSFHQLTIDDFQGAPRNTSNGVIAYTNCTINFHYEARRQNGYYRLDFNIQLTLNNNRSWMDKSRVTSDDMLTEILKHEQGHYIIAYLEQQELLRTVGKTVFHEDYQYQAKNIFDRIDAKYKQLNRDYDDDTQHMRNREQQHSWDLYFKKRLAVMPPT